MVEETTEYTGDVAQESHEEELQASSEDGSEDSPQERNWRELRKQAKDARRKEEEHARKIATLEEQLEAIRSANPSAKAQPEEDEEDISDDDWVPKRYLNKKMSALEATIAEQERRFVESQKKIHERDAKDAIEALKHKHEDFDEVTSKENIEYLQEHDPELAESITSLKGNPYKQAVAAYKILKNTEYYKNKQYAPDKERAMENKQKPGSVQSVRKGGPLAEANKFDGRLTPEMRERYRKEMVEAIKGG